LIVARLAIETLRNIGLNEPQATLLMIYPVHLARASPLRTDSQIDQRTGRGVPTLFLLNRRPTSCYHRLFRYRLYHEGKPSFQRSVLQRC
jgi:hypothetical protein